jgi:hypothetical protein
MRSKFTFKGQDGSMGYVHGREYDLEVELGGFWPYMIYPQRSSGADPCAYESKQKFEENWIRTYKYKRIFNEVDPYGEENWD